MYELINDVPLEIKEYKGQRVVTFKDIDTVHGRPEGTAKRNFNTNRQYFIEGVDFFKVKCSEVSTFFVPTPNGFNPNADVILMTLSGYLMVAKSLTDELSWSIQRLLVNSYFRVQEQNQNYNDLLQKYNDLASRIATLESKQAKSRKLVIPDEEDNEIKIVLDFINECCMKRVNGYNKDGITTKVLYDYFVKWCYQEKNVTPPKKTDFVKGVCIFFGVSYKNKNKIRSKTSEQRYYIITLRPEYINK